MARPKLRIKKGVTRLARDLATVHLEGMLTRAPVGDGEADIAAVLTESGGGIEHRRGRGIGTETGSVGTADLVMRMAVILAVTDTGRDPGRGIAILEDDDRAREVKRGPAKITGNVETIVIAQTQETGISLTVAAIEHAVYSHTRSQEFWNK